MADDGEGGQEVVSAKLTEAESSEHVKMSHGKLRVNEKGFAFVGDTFIPPNLVNKDWDGQEVSVTQLWDLNPKKKEMSWRGIELGLVG